MKRNLLKLALCAMALLPIGAWAQDPWYGTENVVSSTTTWKFDNTTAYTTSEMRGINSHENLYSRCKSNGGRGFKYADTDETGNLKFSNDNVEFTVTRMAIATNSGTINSGSNTIKTAGQGSTNDEINNVNPYFAFNATVPGTVYVLIKGFIANSDKANALSHSEKNTAASACRIYFISGGGSDVVGGSGTNKTNEQGTDNIMEISATSTTPGSFFIGSQNNTCQIYAIRFVPTTYTLDITANNGTVTRSPMKDQYDYNDVVTLAATPSEGYVFGSWTGVDSSSENTATVTMTENKNVTATFTRTGAATTFWNFDQYVKEDEPILKKDEGGAEAKEYSYGLYLHTRSVSGTNHYIVSKKVTLSSALETQFGTYAAGSYMTAYIGQPSSTPPTAEQAAGECTTIDGISFSAPAAGKFYAAIVRFSKSSVISIYKNGVKQGEDITFSDTQAKQLEISVAANDVIYLLASGARAYLLNAGFVPTEESAITYNVPISSAGAATFSSTHNYKWSDDNLKAYVVSAVNETSATLKEVSKTEGIPACTGVVLIAPKGSYTLTSSATATAVGTNYMKANIVNYELPANDGNGNYNYTLAAGPTFKHSNGSGTLAAGKAFLCTTVNVEGGEARGLTFDFDSETTGISTKSLDNNTAELKFYNMQGMQVKNPGKGLYIVNGKKIIIK